MKVLPDEYFFLLNDNILESIAIICVYMDSRKEKFSQEEIVASVASILSALAATSSEGICSEELTNFISAQYAKHAKTHAEFHLKN